MKLRDERVRSLALAGVFSTLMLANALVLANFEMFLWLGAFLHPLSVLLGVAGIGEADFGHALPGSDSAALALVYGLSWLLNTLLLWPVVLLAGRLLRAPAEPVAKH
jgi:hypothetical protein